MQKKAYSDSYRSKSHVFPCNLPSLTGLTLKVSLFNCFIEYTASRLYLSTLNVHVIHLATVDNFQATEP
ncbi:hypothetical protein SAMN04244570_2465 [Sporosarcina newyorkensis]|uniref:Uncharacterized protein n=1 Tax=Sporosarcina newyorkensis TaxID=759851 RepID=A0A1T4YEZ1_9BACL|nr:hypothetical protein SAMN04244570_2465 [Sporosarcina newyorkensis]